MKGEIEHSVLKGKQTYKDFMERGSGMRVIGVAQGSQLTLKAF